MNRNPAGTPSGPETPRRRATLREVSKLAGVSLKTASRVMNGEPDVGATLTAKVREAAASLDYRPNLTARNLRRKDRATRTIGVVLFDVANAFSSTLQRAIEDTAAKRGIVVISSGVDEEPTHERDNALVLIERQVDGLIIVPAGDDQSYLMKDQQLGLKVVFVDRIPQLLRGDAVVSDNRGGSYRAVNHLLEVGHTRIGFLGDRDHIWTMVERRQGYFDALRDAGIRVDESLVRTNLHSAQEIREAIMGIVVEGKASAVFTAQNLITVESIRTLRALGLVESIALVGFDDIETADLLVPGVTVVAQDPTVIGTFACEILLSRIDGDSSPTQTHVIPVTLIQRGSGEIPPR